MKKKLKRIICIVMVLICLCMQGCLLVGISNCAEERYISIAEKYMQEHKQIADSFASEAPEYAFTMKLESEFIDNDDALKQGYSQISHNIYANNSGNAFDLIYRINNNFISDDNAKIIGYEFSSFNPTTNERKSITIDTTNKISHFAFFDFDEIYNFLYDGKIFLVTYTDDVIMFRGDRYNKTSRPPALYIMDFDNGKLIYVGYFVEYFNYVEENDYIFYATDDFYIKMTKTEGVN